MGGSLDRLAPRRALAASTAGLAAGASKLGGVAVIALVVAGAAPPSIAATALIGAVPIALAALALTWVGVETRKRPSKTSPPRSYGAGAARC